MRVGVWITTRTMVPATLETPNLLSGAYGAGAYGTVLRVVTLAAVSDGVSHLVFMPFSGGIGFTVFTCCAGTSFCALTTDAVAFAAASRAATAAS